MPRLRKLAGSFWLRALVSAGLLTLVATQIDFGQAGERLASGRWGWFVAAVAALFASFVLGAIRWHVFLDAAGVEVSLRGAIRAYLIGTFTTNFLPSQVGGDVARAWIAGRRGTRLRAATTVVVDRATALACLVVIGFLAVAAHPGPVPGEILAALAASGSAVVAAGVGTVLFMSIGPWRTGPASARLAPGAREVRQALRSCLAGAVVGRTVLIGLGFQGLVCLAAWLVVRSIAIDLPFSVLAASLAPVLVVSAAPISIGGLGVREGSYVLLLGYAGVSTTDATLLSLSFAVAFALASLPGALALLARARAGSETAASRVEPAACGVDEEVGSRSFRREVGGA